MDLLPNLAFGFSVAVTPMNIFLCLIGALVGTLIGVLPGIGPLATIAMLLPITFGLPPVGALIMLAGIYYGAQYGGSTTSILINIPGESSSVVTTLDGHQMAKQGRAGPALAIAAIGSFIAGTVRHHPGGGARRAAHRARAQVRPGRILLADGARPRVRGRARQGLGAQGDRDGPVRAVALVRRLGHRDRPVAPFVRHPGARRRHRLRHGRDGRVRLRRDHAQPGAGIEPRYHRGQDHRPDADDEGLQGLRPARSGAARSSARCSASCRAAAP